MEAPQCSAGSDNKEKAVLPVLHEDIRNQDVPFDFAINVGEESFPVHQITLTTHSEYFRAMLAHDTKENQQGFVDMKEVSLDGVRECVEFMYSGKVNVEAETVDDILQAADMMQLAKVIKTCTKVFNQILKPGNCIFVFNSATKYSFTEIQENVQRMHKDSFNIGIIELFNLSRDGFIEFHKTNSSLGNEVAWEYVITWIKYDPGKRSKFVCEFLELLKWKEFPSTIILQKLWAEPIVRMSTPCRDFLFEKLFLNSRQFKSNLKIGNYFVLKILCHELKYVVQEIKDIVSKFLKLNFLSLSMEPGFKLLNANEFVSLFTDEASRGIVAENWKWNAMITWIKHDNTRKKYLSELTTAIKFNHLPRSLMDIAVENEPLVKECSHIFISALNQLMYKRTRSFIAVLYSNGLIRALNAKNWSDLKESPAPVKNADLFNFSGKLCLLNGTTLFYLQGNEWIEKRSMDSDETGRRMITTLGDCIYVVFKEKMLRYNSFLDSWTAFTLHTQVEFIVSVAALDVFVNIHAYKSDPHANTGRREISFRFDVEKNEWMSHGIWNPNLLAVNDEIYACEKDYIGKYETGCWKSLTTLPNVRIEKKVVGGRNMYVSQNRPETLINLNGDILHFDKIRKIHIYDEIGNTWNLLCEIPVFVGGIQGQEIKFKVISVCSF